MSARVRAAMMAGASLLLLADALVWLAGSAPLAAFVQALAGTWGTWYGAGQVIFKATPLLFSGLAFGLARRAGLFNIGVEGQMTFAALVTGALAASLPAGASAAWALPLLITTAAASGALWAAPAGAMRAFFGAHEVIATIMLNRVADLLVPLLLAHGWGVSTVRTGDVPRGGRVPRLDAIVAALHGSAASLAVVLAVGAAFAVDAWQRRSRAGREIGWVGLGAGACEAAGIAVASRTFLAMTLSGAVAGLAATATVLGYKGYFEVGLGSGAGFAGVAVALIGRAGPLALCAAALLLGTLAQAGLVLNASVPKEVMDVIVGATIIAVGVASRDRGRGPSR